MGTVATTPKWHQDTSNAESNNSTMSQTLLSPMRKNINTQASSRGDQTSISATAVALRQDQSVSTLLAMPQGVHQGDVDIWSPPQQDVNRITFQVNNAGRSICVPKASTARIIHFTAQSDDYNRYKKQGYDSDGGLGSFYDAVLMKEEIDNYHEEKLVPTDPIDPINCPIFPRKT